MRDDYALSDGYVEEYILSEQPHIVRFALQVPPSPHAFAPNADDVPVADATHAPCSHIRKRLRNEGVLCAAPLIVVSNQPQHAHPLIAWLRASGFHNVRTVQGGHCSWNAVVFNTGEAVNRTKIERRKRGLHRLVREQSLDTRMTAREMPSAMPNPLTLQTADTRLNPWLYR